MSNDKKTECQKSLIAEARSTGRQYALSGWMPWVIPGNVHDVERGWRKFVDVMLDRLVKGTDLRACMEHHLQHIQGAAENDLLEWEQSVKDGFFEAHAENKDEGLEKAHSFTLTRWRDITDGEFDALWDDPECRHLMIQAARLVYTLRLGRDTIHDGYTITIPNIDGWKLHYQAYAIGMNIDQDQ